MLGFGPQDRDLGLKAGIWALRLKFERGRRRRKRKRNFTRCVKAKVIDSFGAAAQKPLLKPIQDFALQTSVGN